MTARHGHFWRTSESLYPSLLPYKGLKEPIPHQPVKSLKPQPFTKRTTRGDDTGKRPVLELQASSPLENVSRFLFRALSGDTGHGWSR